jgi:glycosyltransferase involved in cell wall biosynthesis
MHIVILYQYYLRPGEAGHSRVNEYAQFWSKLGHQVTVLTGQYSYMMGKKNPKCNWRLSVKERDGKVVVYRCFVPSELNRSFLRRTLAYFSFALSSAIVFWRLKRPDVLLVSSPPLTIGFAALAIKAFRRIPMIFEVRDLWPESAVTTGVLRNRLLIRLLSWLERRCYTKSVALNVLTPAFKENIVQRGLIPAERIANIQAGVDLDDMHPSKRSLALRQELGWGNRKVVLYTGAIGRANRLSQLVETARLLAGRPDILIAVVGAGMEEESIRQQIIQLGLTNMILHGPRPKEAIPPIIASADICTAVLMNTDTFKTVFPNKVFDYMACGRPVVLGIDGIIRDLVEKVDAGIFAEPENPEALRSAILTLIDNPGRAKRCGENGRLFVEKEFNRDQMATRYANLLEEACHGRVSFSLIRQGVGK